MSVGSAQRHLIGYGVGLGTAVGDGHLRQVTFALGSKATECGTSVRLCLPCGLDGLTDGGEFNGCRVATAYLPALRCWCEVVGHLIDGQRHIVLRGLCEEAHYVGHALSGGRDLDAVAGVGAAGAVTLKGNGLMVAGHRDVVEVLCQAAQPIQRRLVGGV